MKRSKPVIRRQKIRAGRKPLISLQRAAWLLTLGIAIGTLLHAVGWAESALNQDLSGIPQISATPKASKTKVMDYTHPTGLYRLRYPADWQVSATDKGLLLKSSADSGETGVFGILQRPDNLPNATAIMRELQAPGRSTAMTKSDAQVAGMPATKLSGTKANDPNTRIVEYYLQNANGQQYYIMMMAPAGSWSHFAGAFYTMMRTLSFQ